MKRGLFFFLFFWTINAIGQPWKIKSAFAIAFCDQYPGYRIVNGTIDKKSYFFGYDKNDSSVKVFQFEYDVETHLKNGWFQKLDSQNTNSFSILFEQDNRPVGSPENPTGSIEGIINKAYDVSKSKNKAHSTYVNPRGFAGQNSAETNAWAHSVSAALRANMGISNVGRGVIFYNSASATYYDNNKQLQKIQLDITVNGVKGLWKFKQ
jgi:hypothetical protein